MTLVVAVAVGAGVIVNWDGRQAAPTADTVTASVDDSVETGFDLDPEVNSEQFYRPAPELMPPIFGEVDKASTTLLQPWLEDVFLATYDRPEAIVRTDFMAVDAEYIQQELTRSLRSAQTYGENVEASIKLNLFPDTVYEIVTTKYRLGSTGYKNFGASIVGATGLGREYFQFVISPDGRVQGRGVTAAGVYSISQTPDPAVLLVVEIDENIMSHSVRID